jgi:hypothetical protein
MSKQRGALERLGPGQLRELVAAVAECLWPGGDPDHEWSPDTLDEVASVLGRHGPGPAMRQDESRAPGLDRVAEVCKAALGNVPGVAVTEEQGNPWAFGVRAGDGVQLRVTLDEADVGEDEGGEGRPLDMDLEAPERVGGPFDALAVLLAALARDGAVAGLIDDVTTDGDGRDCEAVFRLGGAFRRLAVR